MKFLLIIVGIYICFMLVIRYIVPAMLRGYVKHYTKKFYDDMEAERASSLRKEGEVKITHDPGKNRKKIDDAGEYVEYEEIK